MSAESPDRGHLPTSSSMSPSSATARAAAAFAPAKAAAEGSGDDWSTSGEDWQAASDPHPASAATPSDSAAGASADALALSPTATGQIQDDAHFSAGTPPLHRKSPLHGNTPIAWGTIERQVDRASTAATPSSGLADCRAGRCKGASTSGNSCKLTHTSWNKWVPPHEPAEP